MTGYHPRIVRAARPAGPGDPEANPGSLSAGFLRGGRSFFPAEELRSWREEGEERRRRRRIEGQKISIVDKKELSVPLSEASSGQRRAAAAARVRNRSKRSSYASYSFKTQCFVSDSYRWHRSGTPPSSVLSFRASPPLVRK